MRKFAIWMMLTLGILIGIMPAVAQNDTMQLRLAHWSVDASPVDIYANGELIVEALEYPTVTDWIELEEGFYDIAVAPAGTSLEEAVLGPWSYNLVGGTWITIAVVGSADAGTLANNVLIESYNPISDPEFARVSITHAVAGAEPITMMINDLVATTSLAYPGTRGKNDGFFVRDIPAGAANIQVFVTNQPDVELASESGVMLEAGMNYLLAAIGSADAPQLLVVASSLNGETTIVSDVASLAADAIASQAATDEPTEEATVEEVTAEPTEETAVEEATVEPTLEPTVEEATSEPTIEPTVEEATSEPTIEPTVEATEEAAAVEEATSEPTAEAMDEAMPEMTEESMMNEAMPEATEAVAMDEATEEPIDAEMTPEVEMTEEPMDEGMSELSNTIADVVIATEANESEFTVLLAALFVADESIAETLSDPDAKLTVFAPTDEAFLALLQDMDIDIDTLLSDTDLLNTLLPYHVVDGVVMADAIMTMDGEEIPTLSGDDALLTITVTEDGVMLNDTIHVIETDIEAENGVIHVIDGVLVPVTQTE